MYQKDLNNKQLPIAIQLILSIVSNRKFYANLIYLFFLVNNTHTTLKFQQVISGNKNLNVTVRLVYWNGFFLFAKDVFVKPLPVVPDCRQSFPWFTDAVAKSLVNN